MHVHKRYSPNMNVISEGIVLDPHHVLVHTSTSMVAYTKQICSHTDRQRRAIRLENADMSIESTRDGLPPCHLVMAGTSAAF